MTRNWISRALISCLWVSLVLTSGCATTNNWEPEPAAPQGFRELTWGAAPSSELPLPPVSVRGDTKVYQLTSAARPGRLLGIPVAEEAYSFHQDHFYMGNAWIDGAANFERVKQALTKKYGDASRKIKDYDRKFAKSDKGFKDMWVWRWPDSTAEVRLSYHAGYERATVTFINDAIRKATAAPASEPVTEGKAAATP